MSTLESPVPLADALVEWVKLNHAVTPRERITTPVPVHTQPLRPGAALDCPLRHAAYRPRQTALCGDARGASLL